MLSRVQLFMTPMDCSLPGSSIHGIFQAKILEWFVISFSTKTYWLYFNIFFRLSFPSMPVVSTFLISYFF